MGFFVKAVPRSEFDSWVKQQQATQSPPATTTPAASPTG
jgi:heme/copper-type cytochrome/quinol oxidase subunit 2